MSSHIAWVDEERLRNPLADEDMTDIVSLLAIRFVHQPIALTILCSHRTSSLHLSSSSNPSSSLALIKRFWALEGFSSNRWICRRLISSSLNALRRWFLYSNAHKRISLVRRKSSVVPGFWGMPHNLNHSVGIEGIDIPLELADISMELVWKGKWEYREKPCLPNPIT